MERHQLEDRIRASLQARADDVAPTPELWERVSDRTTRRARWQLGAWALSGAAAVVALVVGGVVLLGAPRGLEIAPEPDVAEPPITAPSPTAAEPGTGAAPAPPTIVTTDGTSLFVVDPATGQARQQLTPRLDDELPVDIREVAIRPAGDAGQLTVATVVDNEGSFDVEVYVFDADGERVERRTVAMAAPATDLPPDVVWSQDGRFLMWAGSSFVDGSTAGPALWGYDWANREPGDRQTVQPFPVAGPGAPAALFDGTGVVDLREWTGDPVGASQLVATTTADGSFVVELTGTASDCGQATGPCPPTFTARANPLDLPGLAAMDLGTLHGGIDVALAVPTGPGGGPDGGAEDATLALVAEPTDEQAQVLDAPELTTGTAGPLDAWLAAAGDRVAIGFGPQAHLLTIAGDRAGEVEVTGTVALPAGTVAAGMTAAPADPTAPATSPAAPSEGPTADLDPVVLDDGVPAHVITLTAQGQLQLVDRRTPDRPLAAWPRPDGMVAEQMPVQVAIHPTSTPRDLQLVSRWTAGEAETLVHTVVRDGQVVVNEPLPDDLQPSNAGTIVEAAESAPVFSPAGDWLAWVEAPRGDDGSAQVRFVPWSQDGPTGGPQAAIASDDSPRPVTLLDWAREGDADVLTMRPAGGPGGEPPPATMIELRLPDADPTAPAPRWSAVELPGPLFAAGHHASDGGSERYVAFARDGDVVAGLATAPDTAVPTGAYAFSEGRVVAFGPTSALVQRPAGTWQRVQLDDGATSPVEAPLDTVAVLPWTAR